VWFPDPRSAQSGGEFDGLVAIGGDLSVPRLLLAYRSGIFPWTDNPVTWWSPDPRAIFELDRFHVPESLARVIRNGVFEITIDRAFRKVVEACAEPAPGRERTWISPNFVDAYTRLHKKGHAHSVECWQGAQLVGAIYGVSIGGFFAGETPKFLAVDKNGRQFVGHEESRPPSRPFLGPDRANPYASANAPSHGARPATGPYHHTRR